MRQSIGENFFLLIPSLSFFCLFVYYVKLYDKLIKHISIQTIFNDNFFLMYLIRSLFSSVLVGYIISPPFVLCNLCYQTRRYCSLVVLNKEAEKRNADSTNDTTFRNY
uniref:Uncharacterized protein n=1 Tax=Cacopsylla melanoneura TaxID=428564 RepID=A0A8D9E4H5_9HEMI